jgi:methylglutaconyl-CoA hydratase
VIKQALFPRLEIISDRGVATVWMNRPDAHNAFDENLIDEITWSMTALSADASISVIVLAGRGRSFSAGGDLDWMRRAATYGYDKNLEDARGLAAMLRAVAESPKTTIARVHGAALGGGMGLACACDIAVASTAATFATSEVKFGLIPATIGPYVMRAIGARQALRYFQTAERIDAARAREIGLVHEAVAPDQLDHKITEIIAALLTGGPQARAASKELIRAIAGKTIDDALVEDTARRIATARATAEAREGIDAFFGKRPAAWISSE